MRSRSASPLLPLAVIPALFFAAGFVHAQPVIVIDPNEIQGNGDNEQQEFILHLANEGDARLEWTSDAVIIHEPGNIGPRRDNAGDVIAEWQNFKAANSFNSPVAWDEDNEWMWFADSSSGFSVVYTHDADYQDFHEVMRGHVGSCIDGCWGRGLVFLAQWDSTAVNRYDAIGGMVGSIQFPFPVYGLAADNVHGWLFALSGNDFFIHVFTLGDDGSIGDEIGVIRNHLQYHANDLSFGLEWVEKDPDGQLWMTAPDSGEVYEIHVDTDNWTCDGSLQHFRVFPAADRPEIPVAHDRYNLWVTGYGPTSLRIYDDGIHESYWLSWDPKSGSLDPADSIDVSIILDATGLVGGDYIADLHIFSNDPRDPEVIVGIQLSLPVPPVLRVEWSERAGYPDSVNFNSYFGGMMVGRDYQIPIALTNLGTDNLNIQSIILDCDVLHITPVETSLAPGETENLTLSTNSPQFRIARGELSISNNAPDQSDFSIPVHAEITLGVGSDPAQPAIFALLPPAPNPFNSRTAISFTIPSPERAVVTVFDQSGRLVERLADGEFGVGEHRLIWNAEGMVAGTYFCRLEAGNESKTTKLMLLK